MKAPIAWISLQESKGLAQPTSTEGDERRGSVRLKQAAHTEGLFGGEQFVQMRDFTVVNCFTIRRDLKSHGRASEENYGEGQLTLSFTSLLQRQSCSTNQIQQHSACLDA